MTHGYLEQEKIQKLGNFILIMAIIITLCEMIKLNAINRKI